MKRIHISKLESHVAKNKVLVAHFTSDRCMPCRSQADTLKKICKKYDIECVEIDVDNYQKGVSKLGKLGITKMPTVIPTTMIYVNGSPKTFKDTTLLNGAKTNKIIGNRGSKIETIIKRILTSNR